jgi:glycosyltransferase involved in cell wall biosynthesis
VKRFKVAHITTVDISLYYLLLNQLCSLKEAGYEVVGISSPGSEVAAIESAGIRHIPVEMTRSPFTPVSDLKSLWRLYSIISRERFTIVHTHTPKAGLLGRLAAKLAGVPIVVHTSHGLVFQERSPWYFRRMFTLVEKVAAACSDLILSVNKEDIETMIKEGICDLSKVKALGEGGIGTDLVRFDPASVDKAKVTALRAEIELTEQSKVVGFVGRLVEEKGLLDLFDAMRLVQEQVPNVELIVVGPVDTEKRDAVTPGVAEKYQINEITRFLGRRYDLPALYSLMDVLVLPSYREGFPVVPMEASAMNVPCIVTDVRGCREVVEHNYNGLIVPVGDAYTLASAIVSLLTNEQLAQQMGKAGRRISVERFDQRDVFENVKTEYERLLHSRGQVIPKPTRNLCERGNAQVED